MRSIRTKSLGFALAVATVAGAVIPSSAAAQQSEARFVDSWFWGARGGTMSVETNVQDKWAPMAGLEWLITRQRVALHLAIGQSFFDDVSLAAFDTLGTPVLVNLRDYRYASASLYAFPVEWGGLRPYAGLGLALNIVRKAEHGMVDAPTAIAIDQARSLITPILTAGAQLQFQRVALYGEASVLPVDRKDFLLNGSTGIYQFSAGLRFNLANAIEPLR